MAIDRRYQKSAQEAHNTAAQAYAASGTTLSILGVLDTDCGCSIAAQPGGMQVRGSGLYLFSADVTSTPSAAGTQVVQLYRDGVPVPSAVAADAVLAGSVITQHTGTVLSVAACCTTMPVYSVRISGAAGSVSQVQMAAVRIA